MARKEHPMPRGSRLLKRLDALENQHIGRAESAHELRIKVLRRQVLFCEHCKKRSQLSRWNFLQTHWYEAPYSCAGGDTWHQNETEVCYVACPKCGKWNYIYNHPQKVRILKTLNGYRLHPSQIFARVYHHHKNEWPIKQVYPKTE